MATYSYVVDVERFCLAEPQVSAKGVKAAQLKIDNEAVYWLPEPMEVAFDPRSYDGSDQARVSLCLLASDGVAAQLANIDDAIVKLAALHSTALFGKTLSPDTVRAIYSPMLYQKGSYPAMLRPKLILTGRNQTKYWDEKTKKPLETPADWKGRKVSARLLLKGLWFQGSTFGVSVEVTDALVGDRTGLTSVCPWGA